MKQDNFFKFSFFFTLSIMLLVFSSNVDFKRSEVTLTRSRSQPVAVLERAPVEKIKRLIGEGKLSDKEALYYRVVE